MSQQLAPFPASPSEQLAPFPASAPESVGNIRTLTNYVAGLGATAIALVLAVAVSRVITAGMAGASLPAVALLLAVGIVPALAAAVVVVVYLFLGRQVANGSNWARILIGILALLGALGDVASVVFAPVVTSFLGLAGNGYVQVVTVLGVILAIVNALVLLVLAVNAFYHETAAWCRPAPSVPTSDVSAPKSPSGLATRSSTSPSGQVGVGSTKAPTTHSTFAAAPGVPPASVRRLRGLVYAITELGAISIVAGLIISRSVIIVAVAGAVGIAAYLYLAYQVSAHKEWARIVIGIFAIVGILGDLSTVVVSVIALAILGQLVTAGGYGVAIGFGIVLAIINLILLVILAASAFGRETAAWCRPTPSVLG